MNISSLLRELSGPRPLCLGVDIVFKPRIRNPAPWPFRSNPSQPSQLRGAGRMATNKVGELSVEVTPTYGAAEVGGFDAMGKFSGIEQ